MSGIRSRVAALRRRTVGDSGLSMMELIVSMAITAVAITIIGTMFVNVAKVTSSSNATTNRGSVAANIMDEISKVIRPAANNPIASSDDADPAIVSGTASSLTVYTYVDTNPVTPAPTKITFRIDAAGNLVEDRVAGTSSSGYWVFTSTASTRTLGGPVTSTATDPLFVYLDDLGATLTPAIAGLTPTTNALSLDQRKAVASVKVVVRIENTASSGNSDPLIIQNTVGMPNVKISRTDG